jgi:hypothetical protein
MTGMRARDYAPIERLDAAPTGPYVPPEQREEALCDALRGVDLGANDELTVSWLVRHLDNPTLRTVVSLIERVRALDVEESVVDHAWSTVDEQPRPPSRRTSGMASWVAGNSGAGF